MTLQPLVDAGPLIVTHTLAALTAFGLGAWQLARPKGTAGHRLAGYIWVTLMAAVAAGSLFIHTINQWQGFSLIHLLSAYVLISLVLAIRAARRGEIARHSRYMTGMYLGGLVIAGGFTLMPGRILHHVLFGA